MGSITLIKVPHHIFSYISSLNKEDIQTSTRYYFIISIDNFFFPYSATRIWTTHHWPTHLCERWRTSLRELHLWLFSASCNDWLVRWCWTSRGENITYLPYKIFKVEWFEPTPLGNRQSTLTSKPYILIKQCGNYYKILDTIYILFFILYLIETYFSFFLLF